MPLRRYTRLRLLLGLTAAVIVGVPLLLYMLSLFPGHPSASGAPSSWFSFDDDDENHPTSGELSEDDDLVRVKAIKPKRSSKFNVTTRQLASVRPYYQAELKAQVAGKVRAIHKDLGDPVKKGDLLIELDVPDLDKTILQKEAVVRQRKQELRESEANLKTAEAHIAVAKTLVELDETKVLEAKATRDYHSIRLDRFIGMRKKEALSDDQVDEQQRYFLASDAVYKGAKINVLKADADVKDKQASRDAALVDIELKKAHEDVAQAELEQAKVTSDFARIRAPFDGVVVKRAVDPGDFIQNATSGTSDVLMTVARTDIVTVVAKVPDNAAPFIAKDTLLIIQIDQLPGVMIQAKVTRFSPMIDVNDRTMQVEVDLANEKDFSRADLRSGADRIARPAGLREDEHVLPGMNGYMRLDLNHFDNAHLLPSGAVFSRGGNQYIMVLGKGSVVRMLPVTVQVNDGKLAKVAVIVSGDPTHGNAVVRELTGNEEVIASRQAELEEGQKVKATLAGW